MLQNTFERVLKHLYNENFERGGKIDVSNSGKLTFSNAVAGKPPNWGVNVPCYPDDISFHTHPLGAYKAIKFGSGLPSTADYIHNITCGNMAHVVFSVEGFYVIHSSKFFAGLLRFWHNIDRQVYNRILDDIRAVSNDLEQQRDISIMNNIPDAQMDIRMADENESVEQVLQGTEWSHRIEKLNKKVIGILNNLTISKDFSYAADNLLFGDYLQNLFYIEYYPQHKIDNRLKQKKKIPLVYYEQK
jgi:hypothetical protein